MPTDAEIISSAMSILGKRKSKAKAAAARRNGKLGGFSKEQRLKWERRAKAGKLPGNSKTSKPKYESAATTNKPAL